MANKFTKARLHGKMACDQCEVWQYSLIDIHLQLCSSHFSVTHNPKQHPIEYARYQDIYNQHSNHCNMNEKRTI